MRMYADGIGAWMRLRDIDDLGAESDEVICEEARIVLFARREPRDWAIEAPSTPRALQKWRRQAAPPRRGGWMKEIEVKIRVSIPDELDIEARRRVGDDAGRAAALMAIVIARDELGTVGADKIEVERGGGRDGAKLGGRSIGRVDKLPPKLDDLTVIIARPSRKADGFEGLPLELRRAFNPRLALNHPRVELAAPFEPKLIARMAAARIKAAWRGLERELAVHLG